MEDNVKWVPSASGTSRPTVRGGGGGTAQCSQEAGYNANVCKAGGTPHPGVGLLTVKTPQSRRGRGRERGTERTKEEMKRTRRRVT